MPAIYPTDPVPASVHPPVMIDPGVKFEVDQGYSFRRALHSRPRRVIQLDYLGLTTAQLYVLRDFLQYHRLTVTPFIFANVTVLDLATVVNTTPIILENWHTYLTGQWVGVGAITGGPAITGFWRVTRIDAYRIALQGSTAAGTGQAYVYPYLPLAIGFFPEDRMTAPTKLMGPVSTSSTRGRFSTSVFIEEIF